MPLWTSPVKLNVIVFPDMEQLGEHTKVPLIKPVEYWWGNTTSNYELDYKYVSSIKLNMY